LPSGRATILAEHEDFERHLRKRFDDHSLRHKNAARQMAAG
jgi:hypothetical protein